MDAHTPREVAKQFMILRLGTQDFDPERGIGKCLFYESDEFNNILRHKRKEGEMTAKSQEILPIVKPISKHFRWVLGDMGKNVLQYFYYIA